MDARKGIDLRLPVNFIATLSPHTGVTGSVCPVTALFWLHRCYHARTGG